MKSSSFKLIPIISVFFFWGFLAAGNGIFIPFCKSYFKLNQFQSQLIDLTFYGGYFIGSICLYSLRNLLQKGGIPAWGYTRTFSTGLLLSAIGCIAMYQSLAWGVYVYILLSFFFIAIGFSFQQTAANPLVILLGNPQTGAHRLNLAGAINSLGTTLGPLIVAYLLFGTAFSSASGVTLSNVQLIFIALSVLFTILFFMLRSSIAEPEAQAEKSATGLGVLKFPQLRWGMVAIFVYVGIEVSIQSNLGALLATPEYGSIQNEWLYPFISLYWGSLMIGRWAGAAEVLTADVRYRIAGKILLPLAAFAVVFFVNVFKSSYDSLPYSILDIYAPYTLWVAILIAIAIWVGDEAGRMLYVFSGIGACCMLAGIFTSGMVSTWFFISGGLWCSVLWPCTFSIAIRDLGADTAHASSFLIMMIAGGALIPPIQGWLADTISIKLSYLITPVGFVYLTWYGWRYRALSATNP